MAAPADMAAVTGIYAHFVETSTATFDLVAPGEVTMQRRRQTVMDAGLPYLVAELEGFIVGYSYASPFRPREGYRFTVEDSIYVRADCIGHGVGKLLLGELIRQCQAQHCQIVLEPDQKCAAKQTPAAFDSARLDWQTYYRTLTYLALDYTGPTVFEGWTQFD